MAAGEGVRRHQVGEVGRRTRHDEHVGVRRAPAWTVPSALTVASPLTWWQYAQLAVKVASPAAARVPASGAVYVLELVGHPRLEVVGVQRDGLHPHVGVAETAELGALAGVDAGLVGLHAQACARGPGTVSRLPLSLGIQNEWMTSRLVMRSSTLVSAGMTSWPLVTIGSADAAAAVLHRVVVLPPPLLAGDVDDALGVAGLGQLEDRADRGDADTDQDEGRQDGEDDLERRLAVRLLGHRLAPVAEADDDEADRDEHDDADDTGDEEDRPAAGRGCAARSRPRAAQVSCGASLAQPASATATASDPSATGADDERRSRGHVIHASHVVLSTIHDSGHHHGDGGRRRRRARRGCTARATSVPAGGGVDLGKVELEELPAVLLDQRGARDRLLHHRRAVDVDLERTHVER